MKVSIRQISEMTGFSQATVSNALNNKKGVNPETARQILETAYSCGYQLPRKVNGIRFVLFRSGSQVVADTPFFSALIEGVENEGREAGYEISLLNLDSRQPDYQQQLQSLLIDPSYAILLLATEMKEEEVSPFANCAAPLVLLDAWFERIQFDSVLISNTDSVCQAVQYLIDCGHQKIGYLESKNRIQNFQYRELGLRRALVRNGLSIDPALIFPLFPTMDGAYQDMSALLTDTTVLPTAFFADNDIIALGAMKALIEHGIKIPDDVSIIGFDDLPFCSISTPRLTSIQVNKREMGRLAVRRLVERINSGNQNISAKIEISNTLVKRDSVASWGSDHPLLEKINQGNVNNVNAL